MKKSDIAILNRVLKENKKGRSGFIGYMEGKHGYTYYINSHMIYASIEKADGIEKAPEAFDCDKMFDTFNMDLLDITIDLDALQAFKKENKKAGNGSRAPYIIKINDGEKVTYLGFNPAYLLDILKFTGSDHIKINVDGLKDHFYKVPFYIEGEGRKALLLPVNINPHKADISIDHNQEVDIFRAKNPILKGVTTKEHKPEAKQPETKADDPAYLLAVWYAENVILKQATA